MSDLTGPCYLDLTKPGAEELAQEEELIFAFGGHCGRATMSDQDLGNGCIAGDYVPTGGELAL